MSPLRHLVVREPGQTFEHRTDGTTWVLRTVTRGVLRQVVASCGGRTADPQAVGCALAQHAVAGWHDLANADGTPIPYAPELVVAVMEALPTEVRDAVLEAAGCVLPWRLDRRLARLYLGADIVPLGEA